MLVKKCVGLLLTIQEVFLLFKQVPPDLAIHSTERVVKEIDVSILVHSSETQYIYIYIHIYDLADALIKDDIQ